MPKKNKLSAIKKRINSFLNRRPHRSFKKTLRRDYIKTSNLPGYFSFNKYVFKTLWHNRKTFLLLASFYAIVAIFVINMASPDNYNTLRDLLESDSSGTFSGLLGSIGSAGLLFSAGIFGNLSSELSEGQQIYATVIIVFTWLTSVWMLRNILAGNKVKLRDGLYNAGSPILPSLMVTLLFVVQLLPLALAAVAYAAASGAGMLDSGVEAMLFWIFAALMTTLSIYWITSTIFALVIVTIPGMYPYRAIKAAGDIVIGRRVKILLRIVWMIISLLITWAVIMIPLIMFDSWLKSSLSIFESVPFIPILFLIISALSVVWISSYIYLFYREVVNDDVKTA
jgi:hypothetical protein